MSKSNISFKASNKQDDSRNYDREKSRIFYEVPYNLSEIEKVDQEVLTLPSYVAIYVKEIFEYLKETQVILFNSIEFLLNDFLFL